MEEKIKVILADDNKEFCNVLKMYLMSEPDIDLVGVAKDGNEALKLIKEQEPEVVVLDVIMPVLDGVGVLEELKNIELSKRPNVMMLSAIGQDAITQKAVELGASYYLVKPFDFKVFLSRIREVALRKKEGSQGNVTAQEETDKFIKPVEATEKVRNDKFEKIVTNLLHEVGVPAHIKGYFYLREAIAMVAENEDYLSGVTKELYPQVAEGHKTTASRVERAIRHAVEVACSRKDDVNIRNMFSMSTEKSKPTNSEFIAILAERARSEFDK